MLNLVLKNIRKQKNGKTRETIFRCFVCFDWVQFTRQRPIKGENNPTILSFAQCNPPKEITFFQLFSESYGHD